MSTDPATTVVRRLRVLLVDDDSDDAVIFSKLLSRIGGLEPELTRAHSFEEGMELIRSGAYDMHFVDYRLGRNSGLDLVSQALTEVPGRQFVIVTGHGNAELELEARRRGANGYLSKSDLSVSTLEQCIQQTGEAAESRALRAAADSAPGLDMLTRMPGARMFASLAEFRLFERMGAGSHWALLFIEVDNFSHVRQGWGEEVAGQMLCAVADVIRANLAETEPAGRYGESEFCVLATCSGEAEALELAEQVRADIEERTEMTVSIGVAIEPARLAQLKTLLAGASVAAHEAAQRGRNRVEACRQP